MYSNKPRWSEKGNNTSLNNEKAAGIDGIQAELMKAGGETMVHGDFDKTVQ